MNLLSWGLFGIIVGIVANALDPIPDRGGLLGAIMLGVVGAVVGGFLSNLIFGIGVTGFNLTSFIVAVTGSLGLLLVGRVLRSA